MNAYIERALVKALQGSQNDAQRLATARLLAHAHNGLYEIVRPLSREEAHDRNA